MRDRPLATTAALLALITGILLLLATPASAHAGLQSSTPADGSTLETAPASVTLTFDSPLLDVGAVAVVTSADGVRVSTGAPAVKGRTLVIATDATAAPGVYTVAFRVISKDGHTVSQLVHYTVTGAEPTANASPAASGSATPTPASATPSAADPRAPTGDYSLFVWMLLGVLLVVVIGVGVVLLKR